VPRLDAVDRADAPHEDVAVDEGPGPGAAAQRRPRAVGHGAEEGVAAQDERQLHEVRRRREVARLVEADGIRVVGVAQPEAARASVHERDEAPA